MTNSKEQREKVERQAAAIAKLRAAVFEYAVAVTGMAQDRAYVFATTFEHDEREDEPTVIDAVIVEVDYWLDLYARATTGGAVEDVAGMVVGAEWTD